MVDSARTRFESGVEKVNCNWRAILFFFNFFKRILINEYR